MPITQQPTLNTIDPERGQYEVVFGVSMSSPENRQNVTIPNLGPFLADTWILDLQSMATTPARGAVPAVRSLQFTLRTAMAVPAGAPPQASVIYFMNQQTNQVFGVVEPTPASGFDGLVVGNFPFFCKSNQSIAIYRDIDTIQNVYSFLSVSLFTFDTSSFLAAMTPTPSLFSTAAPFALPVRVLP